MLILYTFLYKYFVRISMFLLCFMFNVMRQCQKSSFLFANTKAIKLILILYLYIRPSIDIQEMINTHKQHVILHQKHN